MLSFDEARSLLLSYAAPLSAERVPLAEANGRVLSEAVCAGTAQPPFSYSAMDGYAVSAADFAGSGPWQLAIVGESRAGARGPSFERGTACAISTGAEIPAGADAVVPRELAEKNSHGVGFQARPLPGQHVRRAGEDLERGAVALPAGTRLAAAHLGLLSSLDVTSVSVGRRPRVSILCTGDELRAAGSAPAPGKIPDSISLPLRTLAGAAGASVRVEAFVADEQSATERALEAALTNTDLLLTVGGVSVGEHDWVRRALETLGVTLDFWRVAIKPGKPLAFGRQPAGPAYVLGLPGNPASALVTFALFGIPLLRALQGDAAPLPRRSRLALAAELRHKTGRLEFARARLIDDAGEQRVLPFENQASGALTTLAWADALALIPADVEVLARGALVDVIRLHDL